MRPPCFNLTSPRSRTLTIERFGFTPWAAVSRSIGRVDRLGDHAFKTELAGVLQDKLCGPPFSFGRIEGVSLFTAI